MNLRFAAEIGLAACLTMLVVMACYGYPDAYARVVERFRRLARRQGLLIACAMVLPVGVRLLLLVWQPAPTLLVHDEYGHMLVADTLAAGRLANPPHPLARHFETIYVLQQPTYSSVYPIGQGLMLAVGKALFGHPWGGVLLAVALMSGAVCWMLYACLPPHWAGAAGLAGALHFGLAPYWVNSYWGGAFCAFGGAMLFGALIRLGRTPSMGLACVAGLGWSIVWLIRPYESVTLLGVAWVWLCAAAVNRCDWRHWIGRLVVVAAIQALAGGITILHNRAVTGSFFTFPYMVSQQQHGVPLRFRWQQPTEPTGLQTAEQRALYEWQRTQQTSVAAHPWQHARDVLDESWAFYVSRWYSLPLLFALFSWRERRSIAFAGILGCALATSLQYSFFFAHYLAAYACVAFYLIARGLMRMDACSLGRIAIGRALVVFTALGAAMIHMPSTPVRALLGLETPASAPRLRRPHVMDRLGEMGGTHLVFVRYGPGHDFHDEWVYNAADIDAARIVWSRALESTEDTAVSRYYDGRQVWLVDVDETVAVYRYRPETQARTLDTSFIAAP
jgi:hypothetical protein